jgi:hypothetical protein
VRSMERFGTRFHRTRLKTRNKKVAIVVYRFFLFHWF